MCVKYCINRIFKLKKKIISKVARLTLVDACMLHCSEVDNESGNA